MIINILFRNVSETLLQFGENPENGFGGKMGFMAFLHTWDKKILDHFHIHYFIPAGALCKSGKKWIECQYNYLFPERALSKVFHGKFMDYLSPKGFMRIRHYGFLANRCKNGNLKKCRTLSGLEPSGKIVLTKTVSEIMLEKTGTDITKCPFCKQGTLVVVSGIPKHSGINPYDIIHPKHTHNQIQLE